MVYLIVSMDDHKPGVTFATKFMFKKGQARRVEFVSKKML